MKTFPLIKRDNRISEAKDFFFSDNGFFRKKNQTTIGLLGKKFKEKANGYLYEIVLFGINFHAKRINRRRRSFYVDLQKSHRILIDETLETPFRTRIYKRRLVLFGFDKRSLINTINLIKIRKPQNSYFGHGAIADYDKYKTKPGKIKQK